MGRHRMLESSGGMYCTPNTCPPAPTQSRGAVRTSRELPGLDMHRTAVHQRARRLGPIPDSLQDKVSSLRPAVSGTCQSSFVKKILS